jgi:multiple sugar transport system substrate-binding protein
MNYKTSFTSEGRGLSRRQFLTAAAAVAGAAAIGAGGSSALRAAESNVVTQWTYLSDQDPRGVSEREIYSAFAAANGLDMQYNVLPWNQLDTNLITALRGNNQPDMSRCLHSYLGQHYLAGSLMPLDDFVKSSFTPEQVADFTLSYNEAGVTRALLIDNQQTGMLVRADWLDKLNRQAPKTWNELVDLAKEFQALMPGVAGYGIYASPTQLNHDQFLFQPQIHGRGGKLLTDDGKAAFNSDVGVETFQFYRDLVHKYKVAPTSVLSDTYDNSFEMFGAGRSGISLQPSNRYNQLALKLGAENILIAPIPGPTEAAYSPAPSMGWSFVIPAKAKNPEGAWKFMVDRFSLDNQEKFSRDTQNLPVSRSALLRPFYQTDAARNIRTWLDIQVKYGQRLILAPNGNSFNLALANALQEVILRPEEPIRPILDREAETYNASL